MSYDIDEIIILEDALSDDFKSHEKKVKEKSNFNKKQYLILSAIFIFILAMLSIIVVMLQDNEGQKDEPSYEQLPLIKKTYKPKHAVFKKSKVEKLIEKANLLYLQGAKEESISIFKEIASYNESLSNYNLGVLRLKDKQYKHALSYFQKAINSQEEICISSINAAVSALYLKNTKLFKYYISLARAYLPKEKEKPLYHHYSSLINYYSSFYKEALTTLKHPNSNHYMYIDQYLKSKLHFILGDTKRALNSLERLPYDSKNYLSLGLLSARVGSYDVAKNYLLQAKGTIKENQQTSLALSLVNIKLGNMQGSANSLKSLKNKLQNNEDIRKIYQLKTILKESLFNNDWAQKEFKRTGLFSVENKFAMLFYFTPFKIFNANKSVDYIRKGGIANNLKNTNSGYYKLAQNLSHSNLKILDGILSAMDYDLTKAKNIFEKLIKTNSKDAVLHYNLALVLAQLGEYKQAYKIFMKSYHLNKNFYIAGVYALMCGKLSFQNQYLEKLKEEIAKDLSQESEHKKIEFANALLSLYQGDELAARNFLDMPEKDSLSLIMKSIISSQVGYKNLYLNFSKKLYELFPNDIVSNILHIDSKYKNSNIKKYAQSIQMNLLGKNLNLKPLFYGYEFITKIYTKYMMISGLLHHVKQKLLEQLRTETKNIVGILKSTAYISLYTKNFKKSFNYYNELIDTYKINDSKTLFYAAMSAIGANESANAIALLEISKLKNRSNYESRFALALLYLEIGNLEGASIQLSKIIKPKFISEYFDFIITTDK